MFVKLLERLSSVLRLVVKQRCVNLFSTIDIIVFYDNLCMGDTGIRINFRRARVYHVIIDPMTINDFVICCMFRILIQFNFRQRPLSIMSNKFSQIAKLL